MPWPELITALTSLTAAFGVVILSGRREERNQLGAVRRAAYAALVTAVNAAIDYHDQRPGLLPPDYDAARGAEVNARTVQLLTEVNQALALVQIAGSPRTADYTITLGNAAHGSVNSLLMLRPPGPGEAQWQYLATGAGVEYLRSALSQFIDIVRGELVGERLSRRRLRLPRRKRTPRPEVTGRGLAGVGRTD